MRLLNLVAAGSLGVGAFALSPPADAGEKPGAGPGPPTVASVRNWTPEGSLPAAALTPETVAAHNGMLRTYCMVCHNDRMKTGNMSLAGFDAGDAPANPALAEKMVSKLRLGMMPPPGARRPPEETLTEVAAVARDPTR